MRLDDLDNCPLCGEDMRRGEHLCRNCRIQEKIDNMTEADYRMAAGPELPCNNPVVAQSDSEFSRATYSLVDIQWQPDEPYSTIMYRGPEPGEYKETPFKTIQFVGWDGTLVAKHVNDWFISQATKE